MRHFILLAALSRVPLSALDQTDGNAPSPPQNTFMSIVMTLLPILLIALFIWFFFYKVQRKQNKRTEDYIARNAQHMERIEQSLERIASALEKKNDGGSA